MAIPHRTGRLDHLAVLARCRSDLPSAQHSLFHAGLPHDLNNADTQTVETERGERREVYEVVFCSCLCVVSPVIALLLIMPYLKTSAYADVEFPTHVLVVFACLNDDEST